MQNPSGNGSMSGIGPMPDSNNLTKQGAGPKPFEWYQYQPGFDPSQRTDYTHQGPQAGYVPNYPQSTHTSYHRQPVMSNPSPPLSSRIQGQTPNSGFQTSESGNYGGLQRVPYAHTLRQYEHNISMLQLPQVTQHQQLPEVSQHQQLPVSQHQQRPQVSQLQQRPQVSQGQQMPQVTQHQQLPQVSQHQQMPKLLKIPQQQRAPQAQVTQHQQLPQVSQHYQMQNLLTMQIQQQNQKWQQKPTLARSEQHWPHRQQLPSLESLLSAPSTTSTQGTSVRTGQQQKNQNAESHNTQFTYQVPQSVYQPETVRHRDGRNVLNSGLNFGSLNQQDGRDNPAFQPSSYPRQQIGATTSSQKNTQFGGHHYQNPQNDQIRRQHSGDFFQQHFQQPSYPASQMGIRGQSRPVEQQSYTVQPGPFPGYSQGVRTYPYSQQVFPPQHTQTKPVQIHPPSFQNFENPFVGSIGQNVMSSSASHGRKRKRSGALEDDSPNLIKSIFTITQKNEITDDQSILRKWYTEPCESEAITAGSCQDVTPALNNKGCSTSPRTEAPMSGCTESQGTAEQTAVTLEKEMDYKVEINTDATNPVTETSAVQTGYVSSDEQSIAREAGINKKSENPIQSKEKPSDINTNQKTENEKSSTANQKSFEKEEGTNAEKMSVDMPTLVVPCINNSADIPSTQEEINSETTGQKQQSVDSIVDHSQTKRTSGCGRGRGRGRGKVYGTDCQGKSRIVTEQTQRKGIGTRGRGRGRGHAKGDQVGRGRGKGKAATGRGRGIRMPKSLNSVRDVDELAEKLNSYSEYALTKEKISLKSLRNVLNQMKGRIKTPEQQGVVSNKNEKEKQKYNNRNDETKQDCKNEIDSENVGIDKNDSKRESVYTADKISTTSESALDKVSVKVITRVDESGGIETGMNSDSVDGVDKYEQHQVNGISDSKLDPVDTEAELTLKIASVQGQCEMPENSNDLKIKSEPDVLRVKLQKTSPKREDEKTKLTLKPPKSKKRITAEMKKIVPIIYTIDETHKMTFVRFHGIMVFLLICNEERVFLMRELLQRCFTRDIKDKAKKIAAIRRILLVKEKELEIPFKKMDEIFRPQVERYLRERNVCSQLHSEVSIISQEDANRLFHYIFEQKFCGNGCIKPCTPEGTSAKSKTPTPSTSKDKTNSNEGSSSDEKQQTNDCKTKIMKEGMEVDNENENIEEKKCKDSKDQRCTQSKTDRNIFQWLSKESLKNPLVIDLTTKDKDEDKTYESDATLPYEEEEEEHINPVVEKQCTAEERNETEKANNSRSPEKCSERECLVSVNALTLSKELTDKETEINESNDNPAFKSPTLSKNGVNENGEDIYFKVSILTQDYIDDDDVIEIHLDSQMMSDQSNNEDVLENGIVSPVKESNEKSDHIIYTCNEATDNNSVSPINSSSFITTDMSVVKKSCLISGTDTSPNSIENMVTSPTKNLGSISVDNMTQEYMKSSSNTTVMAFESEQSENEQSRETETHQLKQNTSLYLTESNITNSDAVFMETNTCGKVLSDANKENEPSTAAKVKDGTGLLKPDTFKVTDKAMDMEELRSDNNRIKSIAVDTNIIEQGRNSMCEKPADEALRTKKIVFLDDAVLAQKDEFVEDANRKLQSCIDKANFAARVPKENCEEKLSEIYRELNELSKPVFKWSMKLLNMYKDSPEFADDNLMMELAHTELAKQ